MSARDGGDLALSDVDVTRWRRRVVDTDTCAVWLGPIGRDGYGRFSYRLDGVERTVAPHHVAAWLATADGDEQLLEDETSLLHGCGVRLCCSTEPGHVRATPEADILRSGRASGPRPGRVDVRGPLGLSRAIQAGLRGNRDQSAGGLARALAEIVAAGDPRTAQLRAFPISTGGATQVGART